MSSDEQLILYEQRARAAGVKVHFLSAWDLPRHLAAFIAGNGGLPGDATGRIAALPASIWPRELLEVVESTLGACSFEIVTPRKAGDSYVWDRDRLSKASLGITYCATYLADTGSMVLPASPGAGTLAALLPDVHLALSYPMGCRRNLAEYLSEMTAALPSRLTLITGPSRSGDIEATMTTGVHGPSKVVHYIVDVPDALRMR